MTEIKQQVEQAYEKLNQVKNEIHKKVVAQDYLIDRILTALLWNWHILIEWVPWLAKTMTVNTLAKTLSLDFKRIQFTPDLLPSDLIWAEIYNPTKGEFTIKKGPIFTNILLADEINRSPSKVQSALLEAMAERQVSIWNQTFKLDSPFIVLATQNPIEQAGTYNLPEAQLDRFMMKVNVDYADLETEKEIYKKLNEGFEDIKINKVLNKDEVLQLQSLARKIYVSDKIFDYVARIIDASRNPSKYNLNDIKKYISYWISPRWWISLIQWAKVNALLNKRDFVLPEDIKELAKDTLSHRLVLSYEAYSDNVNQRQIIDKILNKVEI